jgi:hypothetical protein
MYGRTAAASGYSTTDPTNIGAAHSVWSQGDTAYLGSVNGGVWRSLSFHTYDAFDGPHWEPTTDDMPCNSISSVSASSMDPLTVVAGCGQVSNGFGRRGELRGAMVSIDGGDTWSMIDFPKGYIVSSVVVSGSGKNAEILVATILCDLPISGTTGAQTNPYDCSAEQVGIWRSMNFSGPFTQVYSGKVKNLLRHPSVPSTLYASVLIDTDTDPSIIRSTDKGQTWEGSVHGENIGTNAEMK